MIGDVDETLRELSEDGVDLSLIRSFLELTPAERLDMLQDFANAVEDIRERNA
jgi:hypothetical protein